MSGRHLQNSDYPNKRPRTESTAKSTQTKTQKFASASQIRTALRSSNPDALSEALTSLRNQITVKPQESNVTPQDPRLLLVREWVEGSHGANELFTIWDTTTQRQKSLVALVLSNLSAILTLLSAHYTDHALGQPILKSILTPAKLRLLNSYIGGSHNDLVLVTLKLYNVLSNFASGREKKTVLEGFGWEIKSLPKLLTMRRKTNGIFDKSDPLLRPDIRTSYILFLLSFLSNNAQTQTKVSFLEQHRDAFLAIFKGISQDHYNLARTILEVCWTTLWSDTKIKRTLKVGLFGEITIGHILKLYERIQPETEEPDQIPADLAHHFLLAICTRPGTGICFRDRGWYPREVSTDNDGETQVDEGNAKQRSGGGGKLYNKILANVLRTLKVNEDARQQELASKILEACPELVAGYWSAAALTLEPRLSSKWISNVAFAASVVASSVPTQCFFLPTTSKSASVTNSGLAGAEKKQQYNPTPPPLSTIMENILPSAWSTKQSLSKGLQSPSALVQHCTALALSKCLVKLNQVKAELLAVVNALEENRREDHLDVDLDLGGASGGVGLEGQWAKRLRDVEKEARKRVPDFQVIVAFSQQKSASATPSSTAAAIVTQQPNETRTALLAESAQRLLKLYHQCLPSVVAEARFDVGKLLVTFLGDGKSPKDDDEDEEVDAATRLYRLQQLHVLSLLKDSEQFVWAGRIASLPHTPFYILLHALLSTPVEAVRVGVVDLLRHLLSESIMFQEDRNEPDLWLKALPQYDTKVLPLLSLSSSDDAVDLSDESEGVITFFDDCVQRCLKTPYKYVEALRSLIASSSSSLEGDGGGAATNVTSPVHLENAPSPLLMTVIEQLSAKVTNKSFSSSSLFGVVAFIRKTVFYLVGKASNQLGLAVLAQYRLRINEVFTEEVIAGLGSTLGDAVTKELRILQKCVSFERLDTMEEDTPQITELDQLNSDIPETPRRRRSAALHIVNNVRLLNKKVSHGTFQTLFERIAALDGSVLPLLMANLDPAQVDIWTVLQSADPSIREELPFEWIYFHISGQYIIEESCRAILTDSVFARTSTVTDLHRVVGRILLRIPSEERSILSAHIDLLTRILATSKARLTATEFSQLLDSVFLQPNALKDIMMTSSSESLGAISHLLEVSIDSGSSLDRRLVADVSNHWLNHIRNGVGGLSDSSTQAASLWIKYLDPGHLFDLLEYLQGQAANASPSILALVEAALLALPTSTSSLHDEVMVTSRLPQLLSLRSVIPTSVVLERILAAAIQTTLPIAVDGLSVRSASSSSLAILVARAEARWAQVLKSTRNKTSTLDIRDFLNQETFTEHTVQVICGLVYSQPPAREAVSQWIESQHCLNRDMNHLLPILHAYLDTTPSPVSDENVWLPLLPKIAATVIDQSASVTQRTLAKRTLKGVLRHSQGYPSTLVSLLTKSLTKASKKTLTLELVSFASWVASTYANQAEAFVSSILDGAMQWAIDQLGDGRSTAEMNRILDEIAGLCKALSASKPHLVETLVTVIIQLHIGNVSALRLAIVSVTSCHLKPVIVNRLLQNTVQHTHFFKVCTMPLTDEAKGSRDAVLEFLSCLFNLHPNNTCQTSHIQPLVEVYRGTLEAGDRRILSIFQLFEHQRKLSISAMFSLWSSLPNTTSSNALEALQSLEPVLVLRTMLEFPLRGPSVDQLTRESDSLGSLYDPIFIMLLFNQMVAEQPPSSAFAWVELFRTNVVSMFIRALSARDSLVRELALSQLVALWQKLETADFQEKSEVQHILGLLKNLFTDPALLVDDARRDHPQRLPTFTTLLLAHALRGVFQPSHFIYPTTSRFLLQRSALDIMDVPMLYGMLYSSSDENWKKERAWIITFLADGMVGSNDWAVLKRRHTWDLLASLFQSSDNDPALKAGILEVLANLSCNRQAATSLILKSGLLTWIEMYLLSTSSNDIDLMGVEWVKILENLVVVVDSQKIETATSGEWRDVICRCLGHLLEQRSVDSLVFAAPLILRLASLPGRPLFGLPALLDKAVECLCNLEATVHVPDSRAMSIFTGSELLSIYIPEFPHRGRQLSRRLVLGSERGKLLLWGKLLTMLWHSCMSMDTRPRAWNALTPRLLLWRSLVNEPYTSTSPSEWVRKEVIVGLDS